MAYLLFADNPADAVHNIGFAATVRAYNARNIVVKIYNRFISKTFESLDF